MGTTDVSVANLSVPADTDLSNYSYFAIFARSSLVEQTTPATHLIFDMVASVSGIRFTDRDLDLEQLGGEVHWTPPALTQRVNSYRLYLADDPTGLGRSQIAKDVPEGLHQEDILPETTAYPFLVIYTRSLLAEQTTPVSFLLEDKHAPVSNISFPDFDLDVTDLGGTLTWEPPEDQSQIEHYVIYLAWLTDNASECPLAMSSDSYVAVISGSMSFVLAGATQSQVELAVAAALASSMGLDPATVDVSAAPARRLTRRSYRRLAQSWAVRYQIITPVGQDVSIRNAIGALQTQPQDFAPALAVELLSLGVQGSDVASLTVQSFTPPTVAYMLPSLVTPVVISEINVTETDFANVSNDTTMTSAPATHTLTVTRSSTTWAAGEEDSTNSSRDDATVRPLPSTTTTSADDSDEEEDSDNTTTRSTTTTEEEESTAATRTTSRTVSTTSTKSFSTSESTDDSDSDDSDGANQTSSEEYTVSTTSSTTLDEADTDPETGGNWSWWNETARELRRLSSAPLFDPFAAVGKVNFTGLVMCYRTLFGNASNGTYNFTVPPDTALERYTHFLVYSSSPLAEQTTPEIHLIYDMDASVSNVTYQGKDLDSLELGGQIAWVEPELMERVQGYMIYLAILSDGTGRSQVGGEVPAGTHDTALFPEQPRGAFDFFTVYTRSSLVEQTTPVFLAIEDEVSYARNVSFVDDDLDENELGGWLQWRIPEDASEVTHYIVYLAENEAGDNRSLLGNVTVGTHEFLVPADTALESFRFLTVFAHSSLAEQTTPRYVEIIDTVSSVSNIGFTDKDLDWDELGGYVDWQAPASHSQVLFYELYLAESSMGKSRLNYPSGSIPVGTTEVLWPAETPKAAFTHFVVYTKSWLAEQTTPVALEFEDKVSLVRDISFPDFDLDLEDIGGTISWEAPNDTSQVTHYVVYLGQANTTDGCNTSYQQLQQQPAEANTSTAFSDWCLLTYMGNASVGEHDLFISPDTGVPPYTHVAVFSLSSLVEQTTPMTLVFWDEIASVSNIRFVDQDLDEVDLGGDVHWEAPGSMRRVSAYVVKLATDELVPTDHSQIGLDVPSGTYNLLAPADMNPLHYTRIVVYTRSTLSEQTTPVGYHFVDKSSPVLNVSFFDYDLDETDLYGDLFWEAPKDEEQVLEYYVYMAENSTGKERSLVGIAPRGVYNVSILAETPLLNYTHFLVYAASPLAEQTTPVALEIFDAVASVSDIVFEDRDLDVQEIGGNVSWIAPIVEDRVELYRIYVANSPTGSARFEVASETAGEVASKVDVETPIPTMPYLLIYTQSMLMEQTTPVWHSITDNFASVSNISFPEFDLDAGDLGGELSWDPPEDDSLVTSYNIYFAKVVLANTTECKWEVVAPKVALISGVTSFAMDAATANIVEAAVKAALASSFSIPEAAISVSVALFGDSRRLEESSGATGNKIWNVSLELTILHPEADRQLESLRNGAEDLAMALGLADDPTAVAALAESLAKLKVRKVVAQQAPSVGWRDSGEGGQEDDPESYAVTRQLSAKDVVDPASDAVFAWCRKAYRSVEKPELQTTVLVDTPRDNFTHFVIYTASSLVEQSTPTAHQIFDATATVSGIEFIDDDLDPLEFGGNVTWQEPADSSRVQDYLLYFAEDELGTNRSRVGSIVPVGTSRELLPPEISQVPAFTHLLCLFLQLSKPYRIFRRLGHLMITTTTS